MINKNIFIEKFYKRFGKRNYELGLPTNHTIITNEDAAEDSVVDFVDELDENQKVVVICKEHGSFVTTPIKVLRSYGCPICGIKKLVNDYFIALYGERNPRCSCACDELWGFGSRKTNDIPKELVFAINFALNDPYVKTWGDFWSVFNAILDAQEFERKNKEEAESKEKENKNKINGCINRAHAIEVAERIKRIREEKKKKKNDENPS